MSGCEGCNCGSRPDAAESRPLGTKRVTVFRYRPCSAVEQGSTEPRGGEPWYDAFEVPYDTGTSVADALGWIKDNRDATLAFRVSCRMGICGSCGLMVNGKPHLACETFLRDLPDEVTIAPLANLDVERDLIVDKEPFLAALTEVKPWLMSAANADGFDTALSENNRQTPAQMLDYQQFAQCINCLLCYAACPQVGFNRPFLGPAAITVAMRYSRDSRDHGTAQRLPALDAESGVWPCTFVGACSTVCPKGVDPAAAVQLAKLVAAKARATGLIKRKEKR
ncbi:MAG: succinate dehydrogenase iron-sulfur subunit [Promicromonosporaceae bacterium]|nr:succinate dehydrogenase iron-sulfur subunit [Promicromonosporaceae bacterium]